MAFFSGNKMAGIWAYALPMIILLASDAILGWHSTMLFVYAGFFAATWLGRRCGTSRAGRLGGLGLSSAIFFTVSNLGVWLVSGMYPHNLAGLATCYAVALPFLFNEMAATMLYGTAFFWAASWIEKKAGTPAMAS